MIQEIQNMIKAIRDWSNGKFQKKGNYALTDNAGYSLGLNIDRDYIMTIELKNESGVVLSSKSIDFPIESMVVNASYADGELTLTLQNGQTLTVDISSIVNGLVNDTFTIAGINMKDDIAKEELVSTLGINNKVDKITGKGLSTNDYTTEDKNKLSGIDTGAEVNVQSDWNTADSTSDAFIKNKPTSLPASDVYAWAKAANKPSYSKSEVGLGNVPNVATNDQTPTFTQASTRTNITSGEKLSILFGKIMKWFSDLKTVAFSGSYNDLSNKPSIPTVGNGTITIKQAGASKGTFTMNQSVDTTIELTDSDTKYTLPLSSATVRGGVKIGYAENGKNYPVELSNEQMYVNVPWTDTKYSNFVKSGTGAKAGLVPSPGTTAGTAKYLREDGTWAKPPDTNTTYNDMKGATSDAAGTHGLVPAPAKGNQGKYLRGDGTWQTPPNTTYGEATQSANGLMSAADKKKLDGIATGANKTSITNNDLATVSGTAWDAVRGAQIRRDVDAISSNLSDLSGNLKLKIQKISLSSATVGSNSWGTISKNINPYAGYDAIGIIAYNLTSHYGHVFGMSVKNSEVYLNVANLSSSSITVSGDVTILLARTNMLD